jgi:hypothetical protein
MGAESCHGRRLRAFPGPVEAGEIANTFATSINGRGEITGTYEDAGMPQGFLRR